MTSENPYCELPDLSLEDLKLIDKLLKDNGLSMHQLHASWGRRAWKIATRDAYDRCQGIAEKAKARMERCKRCDGESCWDYAIQVCGDIIEGIEADGKKAP